MKENKPIRIDGYPEHRGCGGPLCPSRWSGQLKCATCGALVPAALDVEKLARAVEGRALRAAASGVKIERVAGSAPAPQQSLFTAELLEGGPISTARRA